MVLFAAAYDGSSAFPKSSPPDRAPLIWGQYFSQTGINFYAGAGIGMVVALWEDPRGLFAWWKPWFPCMQLCSQKNAKNSPSSSTVYVSPEQQKEEEKKKEEQKEHEEEVQEFIHEAPVTLCLFAICVLNLWVMWTPGIYGTSVAGIPDPFDLKTVAIIFAIQLALSVIVSAVMIFHIQSIAATLLNNYGIIATVFLYFVINVAFYLYVLVSCTSKQNGDSSSTTESHH